MASAGALRHGRADRGREEPAHVLHGGPDEVRLGAAGEGQKGRI